MAAGHAVYTNARDTSWPVRMAQYVPPPSADAFASVLPFFKRRRCSTLPGTWLSSKAMATVTLSATSSNGLGPSIALILQGHVHEEHLLSTLAFTWPRFRDENEHISSPGKVILASYKKICSGEKHKFAMRFETVLQAEWFFETVKQLIGRGSGASEGMHSASSQQMCLGPQDERLGTYQLDKEGAGAGHTASMPMSNERSRTRLLPAGILPQQSLDTSSCLDSPVILPPRFPSLDFQQHPLQAIRNGGQQQEGESSAVLAETLQNDQLLKEKLKVCFVDPEFQDFVSRVEKIWHGIEEELATELSSI